MLFFLSPCTMASTTAQNTCIPVEHSLSLFCVCSLVSITGLAYYGWIWWTGTECCFCVADCSRCPGNMLSDRDNGNMIFCEADPAVPINYLFLPGNLHKRHKLLIQIHLNTKTDQHLKWLFNNGLDKTPHSCFLPASTTLDSFPVRFSTHPPFSISF